MNWDGNHHSQAELLNEAQESGATVYHVPLGSFGAGNWAAADTLVEGAWKRGLTIIPTLGGGRFLLPSNPEWSTWGAHVREAVERYGINGSFWTGRANPTPITAWEVWNEPNLIGNNPYISNKECQALGQTWYEKEGTCIQPQNYGVFLNYTAEQIQAGSVTKTAHGTDVLFGGLDMMAGEGWESFLGKAAARGGLSAGVTGVAIHPYSFAGGAAEMESKIGGVRTYLNSKLGAPEKSIWITEIGWPVAGTVPVGHTVTEAEQASLLTASFGWIEANAAADNIQTADWYNARDFGGATWDGWCGLERENGTQRPSFLAFQRIAGKSAPATVGVITKSGTSFAKSGNLFGEWVEEFGGVKSISVASDVTNGPVLGVLTTSGVAYVKAGNIRNPWVEEFGGIKEIKVATDPTHGPMIGVLTNSGVAWVKYGLSGEWVEELGGVKSLSIGTDAVNGPIVGAVVNSGQAYVKEGDLRNPWVEEVPGGMKSIAVASDPTSGPTIGVLSESGTVVAKTGSLYGEWVEEFGGIGSLSVASDAVDGPVLGVVTTTGVGWAKQGNLRNPWVEEFGGITQMEVAADPNSGPLLGALTSSGVAYVKQGGLRNQWIEESPSIAYLSVGG